MKNCPRCQLANPSDALVCDCGYRFGGPDITDSAPVTAPSVADLNRDTETPVFFAVSVPKLLLMSLCTFGLYDIYWFYKNWSLVKQREGVNISPFWRAFFAFFFCYSLFKKIQDAATESLSVHKSIEPGLMATGWIVTNLLARLPDPYWLICFSSVLFLVRAQSLSNLINSTISPDHKPNSRFTPWNIVAVVIGGSLLLLTVVGTFIPAEMVSGP